MTKPVQQQRTDIERAQLVMDALSHKQALSTNEYKEMLHEIHQRKQQQNSEHSSNQLVEVAHTATEAVETSFTELEQIGELDNVEHVAKGAESVLTHFGPVGSFLANGISVLLIPWKCFKEKRWPIRDEGIKLGISIAAIALIAMATVFPVTAAGMFIAVAVGSVVKGIQTIRMKNEELHRFRQLAAYGQREINDLNEEVTALQKITEPTAEQKTELAEKTKKLTEFTDELVHDAYAIHQLEKEHQNPLQAQQHYLSVAMSAVAVVGLVASIFFPPVGVGLVIASGIVSLGGLAVSRISKWWANRTKVSSAVSPHHTEQQTSTTPTVPHVNDDALHHKDSHTNRLEVKDNSVVSPAKQQTLLQEGRPELSSVRGDSEIKFHAHREVVLTELPDAQTELHEEHFDPLPVGDPNLIKAAQKDQILRAEFKSIHHHSELVSDPDPKVPLDADNDEDEPKEMMN